MRLESALAICRQLEAVMAPQGYHVALTGGCLYKNGERKDADVILYPHRNDMLKTPAELMQVITAQGFNITGDFTDPEYPRPIAKAQSQSGQVDFFFFGPQ